MSAKRWLQFVLGLVVIAAVAVMLIPRSETAAPISATSDVSGSVAAPLPAEGPQLVAYYFHGTQRCATCLGIERQIREVLERDFAGALRSGRVALRSINTDEPENAHYLQDFQLEYGMLVLAVEEDGRVVDFEAVPEVWDLAHDEEAFHRRVKDGLSEWLARAETLSGNAGTAKPSTDATAS